MRALLVGFAAWRCCVNERLVGEFYAYAIGLDQGLVRTLANGLCDWFVARALFWRRVECWGVRT